MTREPRTERHLSLAWVHQLAGAIDAELRHEAASLHDPGTECLLGQVLGAPTRHHTGYPTPQEPAMPPPLPHMHTRPDGHHLPAALTQPGDLPAPIPFPARPANVRATEPSESTRKRRERMDKAIEAALAAGHEEGERQGYRQGWRWGVACGTVGGTLLSGLCWGMWLVLHVPSAVASASATLL